MAWSNKYDPPGTFLFTGVGNSGWSVITATLLPEPGRLALLGAALLGLAGLLRLRRR